MDVSGTINSASAVRSNCGFERHKTSTVHPNLGRVLGRVCARLVKIEILRGLVTENSIGKLRFHGRDDGNGNIDPKVNDRQS